MYENLIKKYGLTKEEIDEAIKTLMPTLVANNNVQLVIAITDLLANGDIKEEK